MSDIANAGSLLGLTVADPEILEGGFQVEVVAHEVR